MKRFLLLLFAFQCLYTIKADEQKHTVSAGIGFPNLPRFFFNTLSGESEFISRGTGPYHLKYENRMNRWIGIGLSINHMTYTIKYTKDALDTSVGAIVKNKVTLSSNNTAFNFRTNIHFIDPEGESKFDPYFGIGIGFRTGMFNIDYTFTGDPVVLDLPFQSKLGLEASFGCRYFFDEHLGIYTELGFAKSIIQFGFSGKF